MKTATRPAPSSSRIQRTAYKIIRNPLTLCGLVAASLSSCSSTGTPHEVRVSVAEQKVALIKDGKPMKVYKCSTSKFGLGDREGSYATPVGRLRVAAKIGAGQPAGRVFRARRPSAEIVPPNSPGRDPIVTRILWLQGMEPSTAGAFSRCIYIHGTPEERTIGTPASYGCVRMKSKDVIDLFNKVPVGIPVNIVTGGLKSGPRRIEAQPPMRPIMQPTTPAPIFPPMEPALGPGTATSRTMVAQNGRPKVGPNVRTAKQAPKRVAKR